MGIAVTVEEVCSGRDNNFNLIRMLAAAGVLVSHAFPIASGPGTLQPFEAATGFTLGWICVAIFFAISGFLITRSFDRKPHIESWLAARIMRLFPGLLVVSILIALLYGPAFTTLALADYFRSPATYLYVPRNVTLVSLQYGLPGVFVTNPYPLAINGSLWTLVHEVGCYFGVFLAGVLGLLASRRMFAGVLVLYFAAYLTMALPGVAETIHPKIFALRSLSFPFAVGMAFYVWREQIRLSYAVAVGLAVVAALLRPTLLFAPAFMIAIAYAIFVLAYRPGGFLRRYNALGDYSYGIYIYAFPVQQALVAALGPMSPAENILMAFPITLLIAIASWTLVEKPSLDRRHAVAALMERVFRRRRIQSGEAMSAAACEAKK